jgi:hypothetical protein
MAAAAMVVAAAETTAVTAAAMVAAMAAAMAAEMAAAKAVGVAAAMTAAAEAARDVRQMSEILDYSANIWLNKKSWASFNILSKVNSLLTEVKKKKNKHIYGGGGFELFL